MNRLIKKIKMMFAPKQPIVIHLCLEPEEMNKWQKTDVIINITNCPFATLTESKISNIWYHHDDRIDHLFTLQARGFHWIKGSKAAMNKRGLLRLEIQKIKK